LPELDKAFQEWREFCFRGQFREFRQERSNRRQWLLTLQ